MRFVSAEQMLARIQRRHPRTIPFDPTQASLRIVTRNRRSAVRLGRIANQWRDVEGAGADLRAARRNRCL
jgi:hypothetical protein